MKFVINTPQSVKILWALLVWRPAVFKAADVHTSSATSTEEAIGTASAGNASHRAIKDINQREDIAKLSLVREVSGDFSLQSGGGGVVHVEHVRGSQQADAGAVTETVNSHLVVESHLLNDQIIENNQRVASRHRDHSGAGEVSIVEGSRALEITNKNIGRSLLVQSLVPDAGIDGKTRVLWLEDAEWVEP